MTRAATIGAVLLRLVGAQLPAQQEVDRRRSELETIRQQISEFEQRIREQQRNERKTLDLLDSYDRKGTLLRKLIGRLKKQEKELEARIAETDQQLGRLQEKLDHTRQHYARYVTSVYKAGRTHDLELLLTSRSINQFYIRSAYLQRFTSQRRTDIEKIRERALEVEEVQARAQQQLTEQRRLLAEKGAEEDRLSSLASDRRTVLAKIRSDRQLLTREMERKKQAERELEGIIARLVEAERLRRERAAREGAPEEVVPPGTGFAERKGKLRWPVREGTIVARFGNQRHPTLKTITHNTGIEIAVKPGTPVVAVAEGEVGVIWWLPSFGNLVVLNHTQGYHTVYTHLADILVAEGQKIAEGQTIGTSGESIDGPRLHFAIWKGREKLNPEPWLAKQ